MIVSKEVDNDEEIIRKKTKKDNDVDVVLASCGNDQVPIKKCLITGIMMLLRLIDLFSFVFCLKGYFANVAKLGNDGNYHTVRGEVTVSPHSSSCIANYGMLPEWVMYNEAISSKEGVHTQIRDVTRIDPLWLIELASHYYKVM